MAKQRIFKYDIIRAVAIFFIVCGHSIGPVTNVGSDATNGAEWIKTYYSFTCAFVPVFIMLSGALLLNRNETYSNILKHRFKRIIVPFLFWSLIVYLSTSFYHGATNIVDCLLDYVHGVVTASVHEIYWFVYLILGLYLVTPLLCTIIQAKGNKDLQLLFFLTGVLVAGICFPKITPISWWYSNIYTWLYLYVVGYIIVWKNPDVRLKDGKMSSGKKILIDGQQRITAIQAAVVGQQVVDSTYKKKRITIAFNPIDEVFEVCNPAIEKDVKWIPDIAQVFEPLGSKEYLDFFFAPDIRLMLRMLAQPAQRTAIIPDRPHNDCVNKILIAFGKLCRNHPKLPPL